MNEVHNSVGKSSLTSTSLFETREDVLNRQMDACRPSLRIPSPSSVRSPTMTNLIDYDQSMNDQLLLNKTCLWIQYSRFLRKKLSINGSQVSSRGWSNLQEKARYLDPLELMSTQVLPVTPAQSKKCKAPQLKLDGVPPSQIAKMSGNSMNVPCVAAMCMVAILALDFRWTWSYPSPVKDWELNLYDIKLDCSFRSVTTRMADSGK